MTSQAAYDGIILGSGHNSLILQAYLCRAGFEVLCLEAKSVAGGGLTTVEQPAGSGFWHNLHSFYHRGLTHLPWYRDLQIERHGAHYLQPPLNVALVCRDGRALTWWDDFDKTAASFAEFSPRDAQTLRRWREAFIPVVEQILIPEAQHPPLPPKRRERWLRGSAEGRLLLEVSRLSPWEFVCREFEHPTVQAGLLFFNGLREVDLREPGMGYHIPALLASGRMAQMCQGGSKRLADALVSAVNEAGGTVRPNTPLKRILVEHGRAVGVETADGERIDARRFVASGLNPQQTFLQLIDPAFLPTDWLQKANNFRYNLLAPLFSLNVNLREPPEYRSPEANQALMVVLGIEHAGQFLEIVEHHEAGTIPPTVMWGSSPSLFDPTQAPAGCHTAFMWEKLPYRLGGDPHSWDEAKRAHGEQMLALWSEHAPNLAGAVLDWFTASPLDVERALPNMFQGDLLVGAFSNGQIGYHRPFPGAGHYRGYLDGLYLCGSCCHPGGNITGLPGYNAAQVIFADLDIAASWTPPPACQRE